MTLTLYSTLQPSHIIACIQPTCAPKRGNRIGSDDPIPWEETGADVAVLKTQVSSCSAAAELWQMSDLRHGVDGEFWVFHYFTGLRPKGHNLKLIELSYPLG